jgi:Arc/MetJ-type ribon-helix-helix transcriptional regulator
MSPGTLVPLPIAIVHEDIQWIYGRRMAKILVSMPDELVEAIDAAVARRLTTRSAFLRNAARDALARPDPVAIRAAVGRGRAAIAALEAFESGELLQDKRNARDDAVRRR